MNVTTGYLARHLRSVQLKAFQAYRHHESNGLPCSSQFYLQNKSISSSSLLNSKKKILLPGVAKRLSISTYAGDLFDINRKIASIRRDSRFFTTSNVFYSKAALKAKSPTTTDTKSIKEINKKPQAVDDSVEKDSLRVQNQSENAAEKQAEFTAQPVHAINEPEGKLSLTAKFKKMYKEYWYVLLPVHIATSCVWFGGFYYLSTSGVDIPSLLESLNFSESIIAKLRDSSMGHVAIAYMCYKIMTPVRYTVTLGGTTISIKYLSQWGYIHPVPSKEKLKQMYDDQKAKFKHQKD